MNNIRINSNKNILLKQTLRGIILINHDMAGLDMNLEEWKQLCRKAREKDYDYLKIERLAKISEGRYNMRKSNKNIFIEAIPETKHF